ncbi:MAG: aminoacyl-tRNA hydrolase [Verrucomicrobia bacterium]|nr:aminoacyl-tRNA hydrolase [Verrucomicrobiota bacterium]MDA1065366.1 aminoacyl-tRNA hydrolase [Verrucomicrobiota bacterium]
MSVSVFAGLGNPGKSYLETRHNVGFQVLDTYVEAKAGTWKHESKLLCDLFVLKRGARTCYFVKPQTFMNLSGDALNKVANYFKVPPSSVVVLYDDINLELGRLKVNQTGSAGGHNGVEDVIRKLGEDFIRFRIGIGTKYPPEIDLADFVLGTFTTVEADVIKQQIEHYHKAMDLLLNRGASIAMNQFNQRKTKHDADKTEI